MEKELNTAMQKVLKTVKISSLSELNHSALLKLNKDPLVTLFENMCHLFTNNIELCKTAASKVDQLKSEQLDSQREIIKMKQDKLDSVENVVKSEIKSWAEVVNKNTNQSKALSSKVVKEAVKAANAEDERSRNLIIYGVPDEASEESDIAIVQHVVSVIEITENLKKCAVPPKSQMYRIGNKMANKTRPIKVVMRSAEDVQSVLKNAGKLKSDHLYGRVYVAPDRTKEERLAHSKLVNEMKELIKSNPSKHYIIRGGKVIMVDKV